MRIAVLTLTLLYFPAFAGVHELKLPFREAGFTEKEAAAHLLNRFAFGPRPNQVVEVVEMGLETWLLHQINANLPEPELEGRLEDLTTLQLTDAEISELYVNPGRLLAMAQREGRLPELANGDGGLDKRTRMNMILAYGAEKGYRPQRELMRDLQTQKLLRACYAENQLQEVLVDFWFNHFHVSSSHNHARKFVMTYERDAIRPYVLGRFGSMLRATAQHPAMLLYLDNALSSAEEGVPTTLDVKMKSLQGTEFVQANVTRKKFDRMGKGRKGGLFADLGINENYARELLELHTLGVDGGYTQQDVSEAARVFTGWTIRLPGSGHKRRERRLALAEKVGFTRDGVFQFRADKHDAGEKTVMGMPFPAGGGISEGKRLLSMLAVHPSTARFIAGKLVRRFVADDPPATLVACVAETFERTGGDIRAMLVTIAESPEFWRKDAVKVKSPFELAVSSYRMLDADIFHPWSSLKWIEQMGQPLYGYQPPTGFPDRAEFWINSGSLTKRIAFADTLARDQVRGVRFNAAPLLESNEYDTFEQAIAANGERLLPGMSISPKLEIPPGTTPRRKVYADTHVITAILASPDFQRK